MAYKKGPSDKNEEPLPFVWVHWSTAFLSWTNEQWVKLTEFGSILSNADLYWSEVGHCANLPDSMRPDAGGRANGCERVVFRQRVVAGKCMPKALHVAEREMPC
jgi:hypothetical protein